LRFGVIHKKVGGLHKAQGSKLNAESKLLGYRVRGLLEE
jgi:hypothetical protein